MATPLARVRGLGSAHKGTQTFWRQRLTAVANIPLVIFLVLAVVTHLDASYYEMRSFISKPPVAIALLALIGSATVHMRIGLKEIIGDYVHGEGAKVAAILLATFYAAGIALASVYAIVKIGLGS